MRIQNVIFQILSLKTFLWWEEDEAPSERRPESWSEAKWKSLSHVRLFAIPWTLRARILEWVAYPFSSRSSWPRNWTRVSCIAGKFFTNRVSGKTRLAWVKKNFKKLWWFFSCSLFLRVTTRSVCSLVLYHGYDLFLFLSYTSSTFFSSSHCLLPVKVSDSGASQRCGQICMGFIRGGVSSDSVPMGEISR